MPDLIICANKYNLHMVFMGCAYIVGVSSQVRKQEFQLQYYMERIWEENYSRVLLSRTLRLKYTQ